MNISKEKLNEILKKHSQWANGYPNGEKANLLGANLDYSRWPLWCGSLDVKVDVKIAAQLAYHFCRLDCDDPAYIQARNALVPLANTFHRVKECGKLEARSVPVT